MVIDQPGGLHMCIHDRTANKLEPPLLEIFTQAIGCGRCRRNIAVFDKSILQRFTVDKAPDVVTETSKFLLYGKKCLRVRHRRAHFQSVSDDAGIRQ